MTEPASNPFLEAFRVRPVGLTYVIFGFNILLFLVMVKASLFPWHLTLQVGNDAATLINFGAKTNALLIQQKQWFRFVTPIFLHIGLLHLATNSYALWMTGPMVEKLYGAGRFAVLYLLTGIGGVAGSWLTARSVNAAGAGASGALFGLLGVLLVVTYKYRHELPEPVLKALRKDLINVLIINFVFSAVNNSGWLSEGEGNAPLHQIDIGGHVGGLLVGALLAGVVPALPATQTRMPAREKWLVVISGIIVIVCFWRAYQMRPFHFQM